MLWWYAKIIRLLFTTAFSHSVSYFSHKSIKATVTLITTNKLKLSWCLESLSLKVLRHLIFITWKEKDHINQGGNTKIKPSYALQCFSPGVKIRTLSQFGTGNQLFLKMLVCHVNSDISLTVHVAFMILQMSDFSRLALDVYVFKRYGNNIKKIPIKRGHIKAMVIVHFLRVDEVWENLSFIWV